MYIISCAKERITVFRYIRDEQKSLAHPLSNLDVLIKNGEINVTVEEMKTNYFVAYAIAVHELRRILRERGILQELQKIGNKSSGVIITGTSDGGIDARIVRGRERPELPCLMYGGLFNQGLEDAIMMRPYVDELTTYAMYDSMSLKEKIAMAEGGNTDLMEELAMYYLEECNEPDAEKVVYWYKKMADTGIPTAMFNLGLHYAKGFGVERSLENAVYWMQKAQDNGDEDASALIEKLNEAIIAEKTANNGDARAQAVLAEFYMFMGDVLDQAGPKKDYALSFKYAQLSAAQNNVDGIWLLALAYDKGRGTRKNRKKAVKVYEKGAELGHAKCQWNLGCYYLRGDFLKKDLDKAEKLLTESYSQGGRCRWRRKNILLDEIA